MGFEGAPLGAHHVYVGQGSDVSAALHRIASRKLQVIGRFTEVLPNNWKLYAENVRDSYHASLLHVFFATFRINRLSQGDRKSVV